VKAGPELYEQEIEDLLWSNLDAFVGVQLFPVTRQPPFGDGLRPDIGALDADGHVHVIEVKRDIDRRQLAQCLEYAGWARSTSLDELAAMFMAAPKRSSLPGPSSPRRTHPGWFNGRRSWCWSRVTSMVGVMPS